LGVARLLPKGFWDSRFMAAQARTGAMWVLKWLGRHSLAFYLAHQPILFGLLFVATSGLGFGAAGEREAFLAACRPACVESGGAIETCAHSCACVADKSIRATIGARFLSLLQPETGNVKLTVEACAIDSQ